MIWFVSICYIFCNFYNRIILTMVTQNRIKKIVCWDLGTDVYPINYWRHGLFSGN